MALKGIKRFGVIFDDAYIKIKGVELDKERKKLVFRWNIYTEKNSGELIEGGESQVDSFIMLPKLRGEAEALIDNKAIEKTVKANNKDATTVHLNRMIKSEIDKAVVEKQKELLQNEINDIFNNLNLNINIFKIGYDFLKKYIDTFKNSIDA